jgi:hypothetical protein
MTRQEEAWKDAAKLGGGGSDPTRGRTVRHGTRGVAPASVTRGA